MSTWNPEEEFEIHEIRVLCMLAEAVLGSLLSAYKSDSIAEELQAISLWNQESLGWYGDCTHSSLENVPKTATTLAQLEQRRREKRRNETEEERAVRSDNRSVLRSPKHTSNETCQ